MYWAILKKLMPDYMDEIKSPLHTSALKPDGTGEFVKVSISRERVQMLAKSGRKSNLFELFYNVCGLRPPVNNIGYHEERAGEIFPDNWGGLKHAHVIFKGVKRPLNGEGVDSEIYIYVTKPSYIYEYVADMVCAAKRSRAPEGVVLNTYVTFHGGDFSDGEVLNWEWVVSDPENLRYPEGFNARYEEKVWENG